MAGLLGDTWGDPQTQAALAMAAGLLGGGNFGQALGRGLGGYQQSMAAGREQKIQDEELAMKKAAFASAEEQRKMKADFSKRLSGLLDGGAMGGGDATGGGGAGFNSSIADPKTQLAAKLAGYDLTDVAKLAQPNWQNINGNLVNTNAQGFKGGFQPGMHITPSGQAVLTMPGAGGVPVVGAAPGSLDTVGAFQRQEQAIKNAGTLLPTNYVDAATGAPIGGSVAGYLDQQGAPQRPQTPRTAPAIGGNTSNITQSVQDLIARDAAANGIANPTANFTTRTGEMVDLAGTRTPAQAPMPVGRLQSQAQAKAAEMQAGIAPKAQEEINSTWLTSSYKPTLAAGETASGILSNVAMARASLSGVGQTGWGTEAKATAASVLSTLGVAPKSAEMFATNVQTFQNAAMANLKNQLDAATGPQTEGDADRASKLFASLKNTPQANAMILDVIEARAAREAAKAKFYQAALPIAQKSGDLAAVDREWQARAPSVFDMPSMLKWKAKK